MWYDLNSDGSSAGEPGIAGVTVRVTWFGRDGVEGGSDDVTHTAITDADGNYRVDDLPLGEYRVSVDPTSLPRLPAAAGPFAVGPFPTYDLDGIATPDTTRVTLTAAVPWRTARTSGTSTPWGSATAFFLISTATAFRAPATPGWPASPCGPPGQATTGTSTRSTTT